MTEQSDMARRPMVNLDGRTAIITGSGQGIGAAVAKCLASHGAAVVINYVHDAASAQRTVEDIHSLGGLAIAVQADVCDESQSSKLVGTAVDSFGGVDILVNNAFGRFSFDPRRCSTFAGGDWDEFSAQIEGMPAWCISDVLTCGAADASPDLRAYHQHLQQSGRFAHRALPFVYHCQRRLGRHDPLSGPGAGRLRHYR